VVWWERDRWRCELNPPHDRVVKEGEYVATIAESFDDSEPDLGLPRVAPLAPVEALSESKPLQVSVLVLGWSHKVPTLLVELGKFTHQHHDVTVLAAVSVSQRQDLILGYDYDHETVSVTHVEGDYNLMASLRKVDPASFDHVVMIASDWLDDAESSDARTIVGHLLLRELMRDAEREPDVLVEVNDVTNARLFRERPGEVLVSSAVEGSMIAQVAMRPPLRAVFDALFGPGMPEIDFVSAATLGLDATERTFQELRVVAQAHGVLALGVRLGKGRRERGGGVQLNPSRDATFALGEGDDLVVLVH
jgi:hypothetical protein